MTRPKFIDDLAGVAGGAMSAFSGIRDEIEQLVRARIDEALRGMRLVRRDEFDATVELAANSRAAGEDAALRIAALERRVSLLERGRTAASEDAEEVAPQGRPEGAPRGTSEGAKAGAQGAPGSEPDGGPVTEHHHMVEDGGLGGPPSPG